MRHGIWALLLLALCAGANFAADETPAPAGDAPKVLVRERTVYVPYEKLKETFEKEGRGVFLPYEEFIKLWNAGQPREKPPEDVKPPTDAVISGGSYAGVARESSVRFEVTYKIKALGKAWSELVLPLKNVAVETVTVSDPQAVFGPKGDGYTLLLPKAGEYSLTLAFAVRVDSKPGQRRIDFGIPPTAVSRLELTIPEKDLRVEVTPKMAATVATPEGQGTKVLAFVGNADQVTVTWMPPVSKVEKGESLTIATQAMHVELGERTLRLDTTINYKIERNEEDAFRLKMPADMRLLSVKGSNIREWSTENNVLSVRLHAPVKDAYALSLRFERILPTTPEKLDVPFPQTMATLREDGFITVAYEAGLRLRVENSAGLSQIDPRELPENLRLPNLLAGFRYMAHPLTLTLKVEAVQPQVQSSVTAVESLGLDEDGLTGWVDYQIAKVGIFTAKLKFESRWDVVSVGDAQTVEDFQTAVEGNLKVLSVNLKNKAIGSFRLPFKLSATGRASPGQLALESVQVVDTQQDKGLFGISAPKAFKLTTIERNKMTPANVQLLFASGLLSQVPADFELPLAYAYTQQPASVKIALERRQTEIRVTGFHTVIVSEAGLELTHKLEYFIEFAGVDRLQFSLPSSLDDKIYDVKCPGLKEKKKSGEDKEKGRSTWEILLQDKVLGSVPVFISHKENLKGLEPEKPQEITIPDVRAEDVKVQTGSIAIRKETALEIEPKVSNLEPLEGANLPAEMRSSNVYLAYRYFQPEHTLTLKLTRHVPIEMTNAVVDLMRTTFVVSEEKKLTARTDLWIENAKGEQYLELNLPKDAAIRALAVNGVSVSPLQRKGGGTLVKLSAGGGPYPVQIIYAAPLDGSERMGSMGSLELHDLEVLGGVPVNKVEADVYVPEDYAYMGFTGTLHLRASGDRFSNTLAWIAGAARGRTQSVEIQQSDASRFREPPPLLGAFTTQGRVLRFQTLAPVARVHFAYCERKLFWIFDGVVFFAALGAGWWLTRRQTQRRLWVGLGFIVVPLCIGWLLTSDAGEPFAAWLIAGLLLAAAFGLDGIRGAWIAWRELQIERAPDPFIEEAATDTAAPAGVAPVAAAPAESTSGETAPPATPPAPESAPPAPESTPPAPDAKSGEGSDKTGGAQ